MKLFFKNKERIIFIILVIMIIDYVFLYLMVRYRFFLFFFEGSWIFEVVIDYYVSFGGRDGGKILDLVLMFLRYVFIWFLILF